MSAKPEIIEYDVRGQICPSCLLISLREVNKHHARIKEGKVEFRILSDNRQATTTIPNAVVNMGYKVEVEKTDEGHYLITIAQGESEGQ